MLLLRESLREVGVPPSLSAKPKDASSGMVPGASKALTCKDTNAFHNPLPC